MEKTSLATLKQYWGYDRFRPMQEEIIHEVMLGRDTLALLPTGGGKSICFQVPALVQEGICIVISPLIALMKDQIQNLRERGIQAVAIHAGMTYREIDILLDNCIFGQIKFLYLAPERLYSELVIERLKHMRINLFVIDEAHCISEWGHDFRPSYRELSNLRTLHPAVPMMALTATATPRVIADIQKQLHFRQENVLSASFQRDNLAYMALEEGNKMERLIRILTQTGGASIVYVRNRKETREVAQFLLDHGISADYYHAGLEMPVRMAKQEAWKGNRTRVIVATNAFGMGIDKADVRTVIHLDIPETIEAYFQEAGRAGRDQKKAFAVLLYDQEDRDRLWKSVDKQFPDSQLIRQTYHHLCNHFQIAYGAGIGLSFEFDLIEFSKKYQLDPVITLHSIKYLERERWVALSDTVFVPARFKFEVSFQELYRFQIQYAKYDPLIKAVLRAHGGVFDHFVPINEFQLAKQLARPAHEVIKMLDFLQQQELATYLPQTHTPQLHFLQARVDYKNLHVDHPFIAARKRVRQEQLLAFYAYLDETECRGLSLQRYFADQAASTPCGQCDLCLKRKHQERLQQRIITEIQAHLIDSPHSQSTLLAGLTVGKSTLQIQTLELLIASGKIHREDDVLTWVHPI